LHPHNVARRTFLEVDGVVQPAPAPRFERTPSEVPVPAPQAGRDTQALLTEAGYKDAEIADLIEVGVAFQPG
jgi:alpha-methylacyl-CoA racemase